MLHSVSTKHDPETWYRFSKKIMFNRNAGATKDSIEATFAQERPETQITYGLVQPIGSRNPLMITVHEWAAMARDVVHAQTWRERLRQLFGRPGESLTAGGR